MFKIALKQTTSNKKNRQGFTLIEISVVVVIIGILLAGIIASNSMIGKFRITAAQSLTRSSPINGIKDNALWLETSLSESIKDIEANDGASISSWNNQGNSTSKPSVVAAGSGPIYSNTINKIHAIKFSGSASNYLQVSNASFLNGSDYTIFVLEKRQSGSSNNYFLSASSGGGTAYDLLALGYGSDSSVVHSTSGIADTQAAIINSYADTTDSVRQFTFVHSAIEGNKTYINGILAAQDSSKTAHLSGITTLDIGNGYAGEIGEIAIFSRALTSEERQSVEDYSGKKWSRTINRNSGVSGGSGISCVGYTITNSGCDTSSAPCANASIIGVSTPVSASNGASGNATCDAAGYSGTVSYSCSAGTLSTSSSCSCASGYTMVSSVCQPSCTVSGVTGVTNGTTVNYISGGGTLSCNASGYSGTVTYSCVGGVFSATGGSCAPASCTGGQKDTTTVPGSTIHLFTSSGNFTCPNAMTVQVLVVAGGGGGGGGGGSAGGAGGGGGGVIYNAAFSVSTTPISVTVGSGGNGGPGVMSTSGAGSNGQNSSFSTLVAVGGGGGGSRDDSTAPGNSGGSGGGGGISGTSKNGGTGTSGQGNDGGKNYTSSPYSAGGGGGAGSIGGNGNSSGGGDGGSGIQYSISGASVYYGGGGGGSFHVSGNGWAHYGNGGSGGGGAVGSSGVDGTGGGGGGGTASGNTGSKGGSGIVIVRY